jgi:hypothetical protein
MIASRRDAEACKLTPCGTPLRAASGRSQASASWPSSAEHSRSAPAGDAAGCAVPQGCSTAKPAGPAGGPLAMALQSRQRRREGHPSSLDTFGATRRTREWRAQRAP